MATATDLLNDAFDRVRETVRDAVEGLSEDQLTARIDPEANTIAWLVWHLTRVQDDHVADAAGTEQLWTSAGWVERFRLPFDVSATGYGQSADEVASVRASRRAASGVPGRRAPGHHRVRRSAHRERPRKDRRRALGPARDACRAAGQCR